MLNILLLVLLLLILFILWLVVLRCFLRLNCFSIWVNFCLIIVFILLFLFLFLVFNFFYLILVWFCSLSKWWKLFNFCLDILFCVFFYIILSLFIWNGVLFLFILVFRVMFWLIKRKMMSNERKIILFIFFFMKMIVKVRYFSKMCEVVFLWGNLCFLFWYVVFCYNCVGWSIIESILCLYVLDVLFVYVVFFFVFFYMDFWVKER